jgi:hypothetical protein
MADMVELLQAENRTLSQRASDFSEKVKALDQKVRRLDAQARAGVRAIEERATPSRRNSGRPRRLSRCRARGREGTLRSHAHRGRTGGAEGSHRPGAGAALALGSPGGAGSVSEEYEREPIRYQLDQLLAELSSVTETRQREIVQRFSELPVKSCSGTTASCTGTAASRRAWTSWACSSTHCWTRSSHDEGEPGKALPLALGASNASEILWTGRRSLAGQSAPTSGRSEEARR